MLFTTRCKLCLKVNGAPPGQVLPPFIGGLQLCSDCFSKLTVSNDDMQGVEGFKDVTLDAAEHAHRYSWTPVRHFPQQSTTFHWRPLVNELSHRECGLDFSTLQAKQIYFNHIIYTKVAYARPILAARRAVRQDLITIAQNQWTSGSVSGVAVPQINGIRNSAVVPSVRIGDFLFPPHTTSATLYRPQNLGYSWPIDPVSALRYTRDCVARSDR